MAGKLVTSRLKCYITIFKCKMIEWKKFKAALSELLETSSIHGLVHVSLAKKIWVKILWLGLVAAGFSIATYYIQRSFRFSL